MYAYNRLTLLLY